MSIWIKEIKESGKIILLDDSTKWEVCQRPSETTTYLTI